jgi:hypothetical protein
MLEYEQLRGPWIPKITRDDFLRTIKNHVESLEFVSLDNYGYSTLFSQTTSENGLNYSKYLLLINKDISDSEQGITLVHEVDHILRGSIGKVNSGEIEEKLVEIDAVDFYDKNKDLVNQVIFNARIGKPLDISFS